jgi:hypothetical protein
LGSLLLGVHMMGVKLHHRLSPLVSEGLHCCGGIDFASKERRQRMTMILPSKPLRGTNLDNAGSN